MRKSVCLLPTLGVVAAFVFVSTRVSARATGLMYEVDDAPAVPVVIVPGARVRDGRPMRMLRRRLEVAVALMRDGRAQAVLVSGDANGTSGDEIAAMIGFLVEHGVSRERIVADPYGLDTYDTARRAVDTYGVRRAAIATQAFHLPRAVALCRRVGIEVVGIRAVNDVRLRTRLRNLAREFVLSRPKAFLELHFPRDPQVTTPPDDRLAEILAGLEHGAVAAGPSGS
ncbi:YdcF family protein [Rhodococcus sp. Z13]|uniref:YdcF family protein n=1 Tax=Rhodococcus sacchari TaxID=2962047 RepID=A0ACD4DFY0_9NOCA|nr:YdcF family protein [Rhodococcus sp. Z13]UYP18989.1 YdcF family protein [Rhodococcus sp. Z13]